MRDHGEFVNLFVDPGRDRGVTHPFATLFVGSRRLSLLGTGGCKSAVHRGAVVAVEVIEKGLLSLEADALGNE